MHLSKGRKGRRTNCKTQNQISLSTQTEALTDLLKTQDDIRTQTKTQVNPPNPNPNLKLNLSESLMKFKNQYLKFKTYNWNSSQSLKFKHKTTMSKFKLSQGALCFVNLPCVVDSTDNEWSLNVHLTFNSSHKFNKYILDNCLTFIQRLINVQLKLRVIYVIWR